MSTAESRRSSIKDSIGSSITSLSEQSLVEASGPRSSKSNNARTDISTLVSQVKADFYRDYCQNKDEYESKDVQRFLENSDLNYVERYLEKMNLDPKKALEAIQGSLRLLKKERLTNAEDNSFPSMFYKYGLLFIHGEDRQGNNVLYLRLKLQKNYNAVLVGAFVRFLYYTAIKLHEMSVVQGKGYVTVFDLTGFSPMQMDLKIAMQLFTLYHKYSPSRPKKMYVCGMPWLSMKFFKGVMAFFPNSITSLVSFVDKKDLCKYIPEEDLPRFLGGACKDPRVIPSNCISNEEFFMNQLGISSKTYNELLEKFRKIMDETEW